MEGGAGGWGAFLTVGGGVVTTSSSSAAAADAAADDDAVGSATGSALPCKYLSIHDSLSAASLPPTPADNTADDADAAAADDDDVDNDDDECALMRWMLRTTASAAAPVTIPAQNFTICSSCLFRARSLSFMTCSRVKKCNKLDELNDALM